MKTPLKTLKRMAAIVALPIIFSACNKNLQEPQAERDVEMYSSTSLTTLCDGNGINLRASSNPNLNYFFIGVPDPNPEKQTFVGSNFSNNSLIRVTAVGGVPFESQSNIGVSGPSESGNSLFRINPGEELHLAAGTAFPKEFQFTGFDLVLGGPTGTGTIVCKFNNQVRATVPINKTVSGESRVSFRMPNTQSGSGASFNRIEIICQTGSFTLRGPWPVNPGVRPTRLLFVNLGTRIAMRNTGTTDNALGYTNTYINRGLWPVGEQAIPNFEDNRQYRAQLPNRALGSGEYNATNADKWLKVRSTGGDLVYAFGALGVGQVGGTPIQNWSISDAESIVVEPGTDFPSQYFGMFEFRSDNDGTNDVLNWEAYDGATLVASGTTPGARNIHNRINPGEKFNKVVIKGTSSTSRARVGMGGPRVMVAYPLCDN